MTKIMNSIKNWYLFLIVGILLVAFGIYVFTVPVETYITLSILFSIMFIFSGLSEIFFSIQNRNYLDTWGWYLANGILVLVIGIFLMAYPNISMILLPIILGFALLFRSIQLLSISLDFKRYGILDWGYLAVISILGMILSILMLFYPLFAGLSLVILTGTSFIFSGLSLVYISIKLKDLKDLPAKIRKKLDL